MKTRNARTNLFALAIALGAVATIWIGSGTSRVNAAKFDAKTTGMFGIARGQTARINAVCLPPGPCHPEMVFFDSMGNVVARSESQELRGGQATFFDFDASAFIIDGSRVELRAVGFEIKDGSPKGQDVLLNFTSEVFDNDTFKTTLFVPNESFEECACGAQ